MEVLTLGLSLEIQSLGLGLDNKVLFTSLKAPTLLLITCCNI